MLAKKKKLKNYLNYRLKDCEKNILELNKRYRTGKICHGATMVVTITSGTVIASLSSTVVPLLLITTLGMVGMLPLLCQ